MIRREQKEDHREQELMFGCEHICFALGFSGMSSSSYKFNISNLALISAVSRLGPASIFRRTSPIKGLENVSESYELLYFQFIMNVTSVSALLR